MRLPDMFSPFCLFVFLALAELSSGQLILSAILNLSPILPSATLPSLCIAPQTTLIPASLATCGTTTNCYHGLGQDFAVADVVSFCRTYTAAIYTGTVGLPASVLNSCSTTTTRISSICSCLVSKDGCAATVVCIRNIICDTMAPSG
ncbi:hypothetical protein BUE80_DR003821 [Diplocarpon rosae]|nr:hypothetical protein BUE80_DR003821 [Diplocarpon rosae]